MERKCEFWKACFFSAVVVCLLEEPWAIAKKHLMFDTEPISGAVKNLVHTSIYVNLDGCSQQHKFVANWKHPRLLLNSFRKNPEFISVHMLNQLSGFIQQKPIYTHGVPLGFPVPAHVAALNLYENAQSKCFATAPLVCMHR